MQNAFSLGLKLLFTISQNRGPIIVYHYLLYCSEVLFFLNELTPFDNLILLPIDELIKPNLIIQPWILRI